MYFHNKKKGRRQDACARDLRTDSFFLIERKRNIVSISVLNIHSDTKERTSFDYARKKFKNLIFDADIVCKYETALSLTNGARNPLRHPSIGFHKRRTGIKKLEKRVGLEKLSDFFNLGARSRGSNATAGGNRGGRDALSCASTAHGYAGSHRASRNP